MSTMLDYFLDERLFQSSTLEFRIRADDQKAIHLSEDTMLNHEGVGFYFVSDLEKIRDDNEAYIHVVAESHWMRLADRRKPGELYYEGNTTEWGLTQILDGTGWTIAQVNSSLTFYVMKATDATVLELIWKWAKITGNEVTFDILNKTVTMIPQVGADRGLSFRYGRNLTSIKRKSKPPQATRIYAFGLDDLDMTSVASASYIEDYSYYTNQGMSFAQAQSLYRKDKVLQDDSFIDANGLYSWALGQLQFLSKPIVTYEMSVLDLSRLTGYNESEFFIGDTVRVYDEVLGIDVRARVSRTVRYPYEPHRNTVELSTSVAIQDSTTETARSDFGKNWELFESRNRDTIRQVRGFSTILHRLVLNVTEGGEWVAGFKLQGVGVGSSLLTIEATNDTDDSVVWTSFAENVTDGQAVNYNFTFGEKDIVPGQYIMVIRAYSDTPGSGINIAQADTAYWFLARGTTRDNVTLPNSVRYDYTGALQKWTAPDDVLEAQIECVGNAGGGAGGKGGRVVARFPVIAGAVYDIYVGGTGIPGAWTNGGAGGSTYAAPVGFSGGGSSHVVVEGGNLASAMIVAGGGGGSGQTFYQALQSGGGAGFFEGLRGILNSEDFPNGGAYPGYGATQSAGGAVGEPAASYPGTPGSFGLGGSAENVVNAFSFPPGGGGGGWYGGGAASSYGASGAGTGGGGGGGSGWLGSTGFDLEVTDNFNASLGYIIISWETPEGE